MAKRRRYNFSKPKTRTITRWKKRPSRRRKGSANNNLMMSIGGAIGYGAIRGKMSSMLDPVTRKFAGTLGNNADEVVMGLVNYLAYKKISNPIVKKVAFAGLMIESAQVGQNLIGATSSVSASSSSW